MINKDKYDDFILLDENGKIFFADFSNPSYLGLEAANIFNQKLDSIFLDLPQDYPTLIAAREGISSERQISELTTKYGKKIRRIVTAYPFMADDKPSGAIEFSKILYGKESLRELEGIADYPIYRNNNTKYKINSIVTEDATMLDIKKKVEKYAINDSSVLIYGETGTGKELVAQALHNSSRRYKSKFISVNCGAIPSNIMEGLIFGTTKGSFTGAEDKPGLFEQAQGGTLFLDEINSLDPMLQIKLLKSVETKSVRRIGSTKEKLIDVRIVAATNEDPHQLMKEGKLYSDLFYRLAIIYIYLPPLRQRGNDVNLIADYFVDYFNKKMDLSVKPLGEDIRELLTTYTWPGNVRELRNVIEGAFAFAENNTITTDEIPAYIKKACQKIRSNTDPMGTMDWQYSFNKALDDLEMSIAKEALERAEGSLTRAAQMLGISKQLLRYKLNKED